MAAQCQVVGDPVVSVDTKKKELIGDFKKRRARVATATPQAVRVYDFRCPCHITQNWRGRPLVSREVVCNLIGNATAAKGLHIREYPAGIKVSDSLKGYCSSYFC